MNRNSIKNCTVLIGILLLLYAVYMGVSPPASEMVSRIDNNFKQYSKKKYEKGIYQPYSTVEKYFPNGTSRGAASALATRHGYQCQGYQGDFFNSKGGAWRYPCFATNMECQSRRKSIKFRNPDSVLTCVYKKSTGIFGEAESYLYLFFKKNKLIGIDVTYDVLSI